MIKSPPSAGKHSTSHPASQGAAQPQRQGVAAAEELRQTVRTALATLFGGFLTRLPAALIETSQNTANIASQRACLDLAQSVNGKATAWTEFFVQQVDARLFGGSGAPSAKGKPSQPQEESIVLANLELRAEELHHKLISVLDARLDRIRAALYVPLHAKALAPAGLCRALQETADSVGCVAAQRRMLFMKFDDLVVSELQPWYAALIEALGQIEIKAARVSAEPVAKPQLAAPARPAAQPAAVSEPRPTPAVDPLAKTRANDQFSPPSAVDPNTISMLQSFAAKAGTNGYDDGSLAADLLALTDSKPIPGVEKDQSWIPLQRIALAGHFLNEAISDPFVPEEMKPQHECVRFPLVKSALTDATLFTTATHPLGSLINELMLKAATARITGSAETRRLAELLQQVLVQFDLAPDFVRQSIQAAQPIEETQIQRFFELQKQQAQQRRDFVIGEAKRLVVRELERSTFGRVLPAAAVKFLNSSWGPLLTRRLLQYGAAHAEWKAALTVMEDLLDQLDGRRKIDTEDLPEWRKLLASLAEALKAEGMESERVAEALAGLQTLTPA
ncbi:MAG: DUF1631 family protein [Nevskiaceae bacterium]|nr:MAG: DUF1631 family protein [Nevskiaceae bacterium]